MLPTRTDAVLLTGITGFVGTAVALRILERSERSIVALVRAGDRREAQARVRAALADVVADPRTLDAYATRCTAIPADLMADGLGLRHGDREALAGACDEVIHCAASVSFDLPLGLARAINAAGAARIAELATRVAQRADGLRRMVHVSTAYVAGERDGVFGEDDVTDNPFRNTYEQTKHEAEALLRAWEPALPLQIVRPSIVVGTRDTGWTRSFNVLYWPLKMFARGRLPVVPAVASAPVDVVPVDYVADAVLGLAGAPAGTYHAVAGRHAATVAEVIDLAAARFGVPAPEIVEPGVIDEALARPAGLGPAARRALEQARIFFPYFRLGVRFDDRWARGLLEPQGIAAEPLCGYFDTLMDYAQRTEWGGRSRLTVTPDGVTVAA